MRQKPRIKADYLIAGGVLLFFALLFAVTGHRASDDEATLPGNQKGFTSDCIDAVLGGAAPKDSCRSFDAMRVAYHLDPQNMLVAAQAKMTLTARRIARGEFRNPDEYRSCVAAGDCAAVPTAPPGDDPNSPASRAALAEFWHLAGPGTMTAATCQALDICKAFVKLGLISLPPALRQTPQTP